MDSIDFFFFMLSVEASFVTPEIRCLHLSETEKGVIINDTSYDIPNYFTVCSQGKISQKNSS